MSSLEVLSVASEVYPLVKTGGLADVAGALPAALRQEGITVRTLVPGYPAVLDALDVPERLHEFGDLFGGEARLLAARAAGLDLVVLDAPHLYARRGSPYLAPDGRDWPDNAQRFAALGYAAARIGSGLLPGLVPDVVHAHDWQAGLTPAYLRFGGMARPRTVATIHNIAFQGVFPAGLLASLGLPSESFTIDGVEYHGQISYLKAGLQFADRITTVSPTYALEIQTREGGMGLDGLLRTRSHVVSGILNGIDETVWDPARDEHLASPFDAQSLDRRAANKAALRARLGLAQDPRTLLFGVVSRLSGQKGLDLLLEALPVLREFGAQLALLGSGDPDLEASFRDAAAAHPGRIGAVFGFDETLAHQIQGGCDALLVPSRFEPCGLTQLCALRYGAVPVVARVGGLTDTIIDANEMALAAGVATGVQFAPVSTLMLAAALGRTAELWADQEAWRRMQRNGMMADVGWARPARHYAELYRGKT
ncbi:glycogen synthase GlgA [Microvirga massiliensis]|uniref:glycogen synthase GlgA n=1 Tax=Microvirga massiliensis TaxID=1033741 RepID=UPI00062BE22D|nr:glycogen synthase GlgA [Microvirga massiliensis]